MYVCEMCFWTSRIQNAHYIEDGRHFFPNINCKLLFIILENNLEVLMDGAKK